MGFLKNLIKSKGKKDQKDPDNTRLLELIERYIADSEYESYKKAVKELESGNAYLVVPSGNDWGFPTWTSSSAGLKMKIETWSVDGLKATIAFTSEQALFEWAKKPTKYVALRSQAFLEICEAESIERIVIDNTLKTMIVLQNNKSQ